MWPKPQRRFEVNGDPQASNRPGQDRLLAITAAFTLGVIAVFQLTRLPELQWLVPLSLPAFLPWRFRAVYSAFAFGILLTVWHSQRVLDERWPIDRFGEEVTVQGTIASLPDAQDTVSEFPRAEASTPDIAPTPTKTWRFEFAPDDGSALPRQIRTSWYRSTAELRGGDCWQLTLRLRVPHGSANPGGSDYEEYLFRQGVAATATVREGQPCGIASGYRVLRLRQALTDRFKQWLPDHPAEPLIAALTIGDDSGLASADWDTFRLTGTTHLVAISGFNIAIVAGIAFFLIRWAWSLIPALCLWWPAQRAALLGSALLGFGYSMIAGFDPPVARAAFMLLVLVIAAALGGASAPSRALAIAWLAIVAINPLSILTPGLWLSFGAVAAIFYFSTGRLASLPAWREGLLLQLMLSVVLAPLTLFYFQGTSPIGPLVNLIAVPIVAVATPLVLAMLLLAWFLPTPGLLLLRWTADALDWLRNGLSVIAHAVPYAWLPASAEPAALLLALVGAILVFAPRGLSLRPLAILCFLPLLFPASRAPQRGFEVTALDVGQGLSVVVRTAQHTLLFDAGPAFDEGFDAGRSVVVPYLLHEGIRHLDVMMISHTDLDHRGGAPAIRKLIDVREERGALAGEHCRAGQTWDWDEVHFEVLSGPDEAALSEVSTPVPNAPDVTPAAIPAKPAKSHGTNNGGCVLRVSAGRYALLLPADIESPVEARLIAEGADKLQADVLLAPHHGSKTSSTEAFIEAVNPSIVIFPAGYRNQFNHPRAEVVGRYEDWGAELYMTGTQGAIELTVDPQSGVNAVREWRLQQPKIWSAPVEPVPENNGPKTVAKKS